MLGHAGLKAQTAAGATVLCDPWFSPDGCFQGAWFPFPDNSHLLEDGALLRPAAVVISHAHPDHLDPWFLQRLSPDVPVCIPRSSLLKEKVLRTGPRPIVESGEWEEIEVAPGVTVFFVSEPSLTHRSGIVIRADGRVLLDMADARLAPVQLREIRRKVGGHVDVFAFRGSGESWYPMVYGYDQERAAQLSRKKRLGRFVYLQKAMKVVEPRIGIPFGGPPAFLDPELFALNAEQEGAGCLPDPQQVADWLAGRGITSTEVLLPGDAWDTESRSKTPDPHGDGFSFADRWEYLREYAARRRPRIEAVLARFDEPDQPLDAPFRAYMQELLSMSPYFNGRIDMRAGFDVRGPGGGEWSVDFRPGQEGVYDGLEGCGYTFSLESRWLAAVLDGRISWEDLLLSMRFSARRHPDRYNPHLFGLLTLADRDALRAVEEFETAALADARMTIHSEGKVYSVSRYCPHEKSDLLEAGEVLPGGMLRCMVHQYAFDLRTGECDASSCPALGVDLLSADTAPA